MMQPADPLRQLHRGLKFLCLLIVGGIVVNTFCAFLALVDARAVAIGLMDEAPKYVLAAFIQNYAMILGALLLLLLVAFVVSTVRAKGAEYLYFTGVLAFLLLLFNTWMLGAAHELMAAPMRALSGE